VREDAVPALQKLAERDPERKSTVELALQKIEGR